MNNQLQVMLGELSSYITNDATGLSAIQMQIVVSRQQGLTYEQIRNLYHLSCPNVVVKCLKRSVLGRRWEPGHKGGTNTYLSEVDQILFKKKVQDEADSINCLPTCVAVALAHSLCEQRAQKARMILISIQCRQIAESIKNPTCPHENWLRGYCLSVGIKIARPQELEFIRRTSCDIPSIFSFFEEHYDLLDRDHRIIFNMDETMVSAKKKYKVLLKKGKLPLTTSPQTAPHITTCVSICAAGFYFEPFFILKSKKTLNDLEDFADMCTFGSSESGWMNRRLFIIWSIIFSCQASAYRTRLAKNLQDETILLITDGHGSRRCFMACFILWIFNIDLLVLPGHTSHVMQPFDVAIASPLKTCYRKAMLNHQYSGNGMPGDVKATAKEMRHMMIESMLDALSSSCSRSNIVSAFDARGIVPLDPSRPLGSQFTMLGDQQRVQNTNGAELLNDVNGLAKLFKSETGRDMTYSDLSLKIDQLHSIVVKLRDTKKDGWILGDLPPCFIKDLSGWHVEYL